jgi:hypothetical protein
MFRLSDGFEFASAILDSRMFKQAAQQGRRKWDD